jgi:hypothetical protein
MTGKVKLAVAPPARRSYLRAVSFRRILSLFLLIALVIAPASMLGGAPAMAADHHAAMGIAVTGAAPSAHPCADKHAPAKKSFDGCCVMTCVAIPAVGGMLPIHIMAPALIQPSPLAADPHGLNPEADPPPPRFS